MANDLAFLEFVVDQIDDGEWLSEFVRRSEAQLPTSKPRKKKKKTG